MANSNIKRNMLNELEISYDLSNGTLGDISMLESKIKAVVGKLYKNGEIQVSPQTLDSGKTSGMRTVRFAFPGGAAAQNQVSNTVNAFNAAKYDVEGNKIGPTADASPYTRHGYNNMTVPLHSAQNVAALKQEVLRAGGALYKSDDGYHPVVRSGANGATRKIKNIGEKDSSAFDLDQQIAAENRNDRLMASFASQKRRETAALRLKRERTPGTPEFEKKVQSGLHANEARKNAIDKWIKKNPSSRLAKQRKKQGRGKAKSVASTVLRSIITIITIVIGVLTKIFSAVRDMGDLVRKQVGDSAIYNMGVEEVKTFRLKETQLGLKQDTFSRAFGKMMTDFSDPTMLNENSIEKLAPGMRERVPGILKMITNPEMAANPKGAAYAIIDAFMNNTRDSLGGVLKRDETDSAMAANYAYLSSYNQDIADIYKASYLYQTSNGRTLSGYKGVSSIVAADKLGDYTPPNLAAAADDTHQDWLNFIAVLQGIKDTVLQQILANLGDIIASIRNIANRGRFV
jgi:hypothetical protein